MMCTHYVGFRVLCGCGGAKLSTMAPGVKLSTVKINKSTSLSESMVDGDGDEIIIMRLIMCTMHYECTGTDPIGNVCSLHCVDTMFSFEKLVYM